MKKTLFSVLFTLALGLAAVAADVFLYRYLKGYVVR